MLDEEGFYTTECGSLVFLNRVNGNEIRYGPSPGRSDFVVTELYCLNSESNGNKRCFLSD